MATDVAARGLDFQSVQNIIHYQTPKTTEVSFWIGYHKIKKCFVRVISIAVAEPRGHPKRDFPFYLLTRWI